MDKEIRAIKEDAISRGYISELDNSLGFKGRDRDKLESNPKR